MSQVIGADDPFPPVRSSCRRPGISVVGAGADSRQLPSLRVRVRLRDRRRTVHRRRRVEHRRGLHRPFPGAGGRGDLDQRRPGHPGHPHPPRPLRPGRAGAGGLGRLGGPASGRRRLDHRPPTRRSRAPSSSAWPPSSTGWAPRPTRSAPCSERLDADQAVRQPGAARRVARGRRATRRARVGSAVHLDPGPLPRSPLLLGAGQPGHADRRPRASPDHPEHPLPPPGRQRTPSGTSCARCNKIEHSGAVEAWAGPRVPLRRPGRPPGRGWWPTTRSASARRWPPSTRAATRPGPSPRGCTGRDPGTRSRASCGVRPCPRPAAHPPGPRRCAARCSRSAASRPSGSGAEDGHPTRPRRHLTARPIGGGLPRRGLSRCSGGLLPGCGPPQALPRPMTWARPTRAPSI